MTLTGADVLAEAKPYLGHALEAFAQAHGGLVCEQHPDLPWPHDDCPGPGMIPEEPDAEPE